MKKEIIFFHLFYVASCLFIFLRLEITYGYDLEAPFTDDFYYYLTTARNFIDLKSITFDQISTTNGFQPLWFLIILSLKFLINDEIIFNCLIITLIFVMSYLSFINFRAFLIKKNYSETSSIFISISISFLSLFFSKNGMEISLAIFLFSISLIHLNNNNILFSLFAFLTFLARLEFIIFYIVILFYEFFLNKKIFQKKFILEILTLPFLLIFYLIFNNFYFDNLLPESGVAKSLNNEFKFNKETFSFLSKKDKGMKFISFLFYLNIFGLFFLFSKKLKILTKFALITVMIFFISNSLRSAWQLWTWHFFFLSISTPLIIDDLIKSINLSFVKYRSLFVGVFFALVYFKLYVDNYASDNDHILNVAKKISNHYKFEKYKRFAMGDMAGKTSYLLNKKLIQTEGLVSGKKVLEKIINQKSLCELFEEYDIEIYLTSKFENNNNRYYVEEPTQKSKNVKKMKGILLKGPDKIFSSGDLKIYAFNLKENNNCQT
jgi:hypothetical protein